MQLNCTIFIFTNNRDNKENRENVGYMMET